MSQKIELKLLRSVHKTEPDFVISRSYRCYLSSSNDESNVLFVTMRKRIRGKDIFRCICPGAVLLERKSYFVVLRIALTGPSTLICKAIEVDEDGKKVGNSFIYEDIKIFSQPFHWFLSSSNLLSLISDTRSMDNDDDLLINRTEEVKREEEEKKITKEKDVLSKKLKTSNNNLEKTKEQIIKYKQNYELIKKRIRKRKKRKI